MREAGTDLLDANKTPHLFADVMSLIETIAELYRDQWEPRCTYNVFADALVDTGIEKPKNAFARGLADFYRRLGKTALAEVVDRTLRALDDVEHQNTMNVLDQKTTRLFDRITTRSNAEYDAALKSAHESLGD